MQKEKYNNLREEFWKEFEIQRELIHPNIVKVLDFKENGVMEDEEGNVKEENLTYLRFENCSWGDLFDLFFKTRDLDDWFVWLYAKQIIQALIYLK